MSDENIQQGMPFNLVYVQRPGPSQESEKARKRIAFYVKEFFYDRRERIAQTLRQELGADIRPESIHEYLLNCSLTDFLSSMTHIFRDLPQREQYASKSPRLDWWNFVHRVFREESVTFDLDPKGGVHPAPDLEFLTVKASTITAMAAPRYDAARILFERSLAELKSPDTTSIAIRHTFDACENIFKLMFKGSARLGDTEIEKLLRPQIKRLLDAHDFDASSAMASAFKSWTNAAHQYRHAAGVEAPLPAGYDLAVLMISIGASYIRWLISIDKLMMAKQPQQ
jgi:hypothetical protein